MQRKCIFHSPSNSPLSLNNIFSRSLPPLLFAQASLDFMWHMAEVQPVDVAPVDEFRDPDMDTEGPNLTRVRTIQFATRLAFDLLSHCTDAADADGRLRHLQSMCVAVFVGCSVGGCLESNAHCEWCCCCDLLWVCVSLRGWEGTIGVLCL